MEAGDGEAAAAHQLQHAAHVNRDVGEGDGRQPGPIRAEYPGQLTNHSSPGPGLGQPQQHGLHGVRRRGLELQSVEVTERGHGLEVAGLQPQRRQLASSLVLVTVLGAVAEVEVLVNIVVLEKVPSEGS